MVLGKQLKGIKSSTYIFPDPKTIFRSHIPGISTKGGQDNSTKERSFVVTYIPIFLVPDKAILIPLWSFF